MSSNWLNRIRQHATTPPEGAWENIAGFLNEDAAATEGFAAKLSALEITPPAAAQKNIFALLDAEQDTAAFEQRVYNYKEDAPAAVWPKIVTELDNETGRVIPLYGQKIKSVYVKVAAAVAVVAILSVTAWILNRPSSGITETAAAPPEKETAPVAVKESSATVLPAPQEEKTVRVNTTKKIKPTTAVPTPVIPPAPAYIDNSDALLLAQNPVAGKKEKLQTVTGETPEDISLVNTPNSYISISGPDGQKVRLSSKLASLAGYLTEKNPEAQENLDIIIKESAQWRATFAKWRDKMTHHAIAPALSNFMDIVELSSMLEEK
jgi:hypothetical protein